MSERDLETLRELRLEDLLAKAEQGDSAAQYVLAVRYNSGTGGVTYSREETTKWCRKSAEQGFAKAQFMFGSACTFHADGNHLKRDDAEAASWYLKAAEQGLPEAQWEIGCCYEQGKGVKQNYLEAAKWWRLATERGNDTAAISLGQLYYNGKGVERDYAEAAKWFQKACWAPSANIMLAKMHEEGLGVPQSYSEAYFWFSVLISSQSRIPKGHGYYSASMFISLGQEGISRVEVHLTPEQKSSIEQRVKEWGAGSRERNAQLNIKAVHRQAHVNLWKMSGTGILIPHKSGTIYSNQVGGFACFRPSIEGIFVPLTESGENSLSAELFEYFSEGQKWKGHCYDGIDEETADYLDALFQKHGIDKFIRVDRTAFKVSMESWIYVTLHQPEEKSFLISGFPSKTAILTWPNSD